MLVRLFKPVIVYICAYVNARLNETEKRIVSELKDAVTKVETSLKAELDAIAAALSQPSADVADAVTRLKAVSAALDAETVQLTPGAAPAAGGASAPAADSSADPAATQASA
jgi:hypothetical protein